MHSLSNGSQPTTPNGNNTAVENLSNEVILKLDTEPATQTITGQTENVIDVGFDAGVAFIKQQIVASRNSAVKDLINEANTERSTVRHNDTVTRLAFY